MWGGGFVKIFGEKYLLKQSNGRDNSVSYTHLDVYKRQQQDVLLKQKYIVRQVGQVSSSSAVKILSKLLIILFQQRKSLSAVMWDIMFL